MPWFVKRGSRKLDVLTPLPYLEIERDGRLILLITVVALCRRDRAEL